MVAQNIENTNLSHIIHILMYPTTHKIQYDDVCCFKVIQWKHL